MELKNLDLYEKINKNIEKLAEKIYQNHKKKNSQLYNNYSEMQIHYCIRDIKYNLIYLNEAYRYNSQKIFVSYIHWIKTFMPEIGVSINSFSENLECIKEVFNDEYGEKIVESILKMIDMGLEELKKPIKKIRTYITKKNPFYNLSIDYLNFLLKGDKVSANKLIINSVENGVGIKDLYVHVFQPVQIEVGRLWQLNEINVAQEHFATATTQVIMSQLYPYIFSSDKNNYTVVSASISSELHEIGIRMISDLLELEGYNTYYLGANMPEKDLIYMLKEKKADFLMISATMIFHISKAEKLIKQIRKDKKLMKLKVIVGGYAFNLDNEIWKKIGADGYSKNALDTIKLLNKMI